MRHCCRFVTVCIWLRRRVCMCVSLCLCRVSRCLFRCLIIDLAGHNYRPSLTCVCGVYHSGPRTGQRLWHPGSTNTGCQGLRLKVLNFSLPRPFQGLLTIRPSICGFAEGVWPINKTCDFNFLQKKRDKNSSNKIKNTEFILFKAWQ